MKLLSSLLESQQNCCGKIQPCGNSDCDSLAAARHSPSADSNARNLFNTARDLLYAEAPEPAVGPDRRAEERGLVSHGGYFDAQDGLVVAYAHGPKHFVMRYEDPSVEGFEILGDNPWIDFTTDKPRLLDRPKGMPGNRGDEPSRN